MPQRRPAGVRSDGEEETQGSQTDPEATNRADPVEKPVHELPDRRAIEGFMRGLLGGLVGPREETPLSKAQDLMYEAFESHDPMERVELAKKALELSPDCADAYVLLAEHAKSRKEALELFEKGVAAGQRVLGPDAFQRGCRALLGPDRDPPLHACPRGTGEPLWTLGRRDEAIGHLQDMLRLNPNDNQGVRDTRAGWLLAEERDEELVRPSISTTRRRAAGALQGPGRLPATRRHARDPQAAPESP